MTVTSAPIGSTGQSLDGFAVDANVLQAFRESVVITDPTNSTGAAPVSSTFGLTVNVASTVAQAVNVTTTVNVSASTQIISSIPFYVSQSTSPWVVSSAPLALTGTSQVFGTVSSQIVSSIPFFVAQSTSPWVVSGNVTVTNVPQVSIPGTTSVFVVSSVPNVIVGTVSTQIVSSIPFFVSQSSTPWTVSTAPIALTGTSQVFGAVSTQTVSSIPILVAQSTSPWVVSASALPAITGQVSTFPTGTASTFISNVPTVNVTNVPQVNITSSIPFFVAQSSAPWNVSLAATTAGGVSVTSWVLAANLNTTVIKAGAGQLYGYDFTNVGSTYVYIKLYNLSTAALLIASSAVPSLNIGVNVSSSRNDNYPMGINFSSGIAMLAMVTDFLASSQVAPTASTFVVNLMYK